MPVIKTVQTKIWILFKNGHVMARKISKIAGISPKTVVTEVKNNPKMTKFGFDYFLLQLSGCSVNENGIFCLL